MPAMAAKVSCVRLMLSDVPGLPSLDARGTHVPRSDHQEIFHLTSVPQMRTPAKGERIIKLSALIIMALEKEGFKWPVTRHLAFPRSGDQLSE